MPQEFILWHSSEIGATIPQKTTLIAGITCGEISTSLSVYKGEDLIDEIPSFVTLSDPATIEWLSVYPVAAADVGTYHFVMTYTFVSYPDVSLTEELMQVNVVNYCELNNAIALGDYSPFTSTQDFILFFSESISLDLPSVHDAASLELGTDNFCGEYQVQMEVLFNDVLVDNQIAYNLDEATNMLSFYVVDYASVGEWVVRIRYSLLTYEDVFMYNTYMRVIVVDACELNNYIISSGPVETTQMTYFVRNDMLEVPMPEYINDYASEYLG